MIRIEGNRKALYQWDLNQRVVLSNVTVGTQVHFSDNKLKSFNDECLAVYAYDENGNVYANIPNILLQKNGSIFVYIYVEHENKAYTEYRAEIIVLARPKPSGYIYTETEVMSYEALEKRITDLENKSSDDDNLEKLINPDWNQNDETAPDYIKNRPFYESEERKTVYPITELEAGDYEGAWMANIPEYLDVKIGDDVVINFNGVEYKRTVLDSFGSPYVGNPACAGAPENMDTGEPFCIMFFLENVAVYVNNTVTTCKVGIFQAKTEVKKIDSKFIPGVQKIKIIYDSESGTYTSDITFNEAWAMGATELKNHLAFYNGVDDDRPQACTICSYASTNRMGEHIVLTFEQYYAYTTGELADFPKDVLIWQPDGIHTGAMPEDASLLYTAQTLADEQKEQARANIDAISADELPTASADVKGGVKVGNGLQMDGDTLEVVPEPDYELIENITIEGDDVAEISLNKKPDGTPYNYKAIKVRVKQPVHTDSSGNHTIKVAIADDETFDIPFNCSSAYPNIGALVVEIKNGRVFGDVCVSINYSSNSNVQHMRPAALIGEYAAKTINRLRVYPFGKPFVDKTEIKIEGVRADG